MQGLQVWLGYSGPSRCYFLFWDQSHLRLGHRGHVLARIFSQQERWILRKIFWAGRILTQEGLELQEQ